ncbi:MAG: Ig-like domain-containing protein [Pseudomonadota bacterium]
MFALPLALRAIPAAFLFAAALSACGGGGGGTSNPPVLPPATPSVPSAQADSVVAVLNTGATLAVLANDSVTNGGTLKLVSVTTPAHGTATISGDKIVYVPAAGYFGTDAFSYITKDIGTGTATATADVAVTVNANLTLSGKAVDVPGNATVTIAVGARTIATSTDANGNFSTPVSLDTPASMITITAQGTGAKSFIKLISQLGDSQFVVNAAGAGTSVTTANLPGLNVTGITTALYASAILKNDGAIPANQSALDAATSHVIGAELAQMGAIVRSLTGKAGAAPLRTLPPVAGDTLALVTNRSAYVAFVKAIAFVEMLPEMLAFENDTDTGVAPTVAIDSRKSLTFYTNIGCCATPALELVFVPGGTGSFLRGQQLSAGGWSKGAALTMTMATPEVRQDTIKEGNFQAQVVYNTREVSMRQVSGTPERGFASLTFSGVIHYPNGERPDAPFSTGKILAFTDWNSLTIPADLSGTVLAGIPDLFSDSNSTLPQMVVTLSLGGNATSPQLPVTSIKWKIEDGRLVLTFPGAKTLTLARIWVHANGEERWLVRGTSAAGYGISEMMIVRPQTGLAFTEANAVQRWASNTSSDFISSTSYVNVQADHISVNELLATNGVTSTGGQSSWTTEYGKLVMRAYSTSPGTSMPVCPARANYTLRSERTWTMLSSDANSIVVLENYMISPGNVQRRVQRYSRT